jgi:hypothetical protein
VVTGLVVAVVKKHALRVLLAAVVAALLSFAVHVLYGQGWARAYVDGAAAAGRLEGLVRQPYPASVVTVAAATAILPTLGTVLTFLLLRNHLPGRTRWQKGISFAALLVLSSDGAIRMPVMNLVIGNPVDVVLVQSAELWMINLLAGVVIALIAPSTASDPSAPMASRTGAETGS